MTARAVGATAALIGCLVGCGPSRPVPGDSARADPTVVASTDVWGSVARSVAGVDARVVSIINSAVADPHSFDASPSDAAAIADASVVVYNGGGYDAWVGRILDSHRGISAINAYSLLDGTAIGEPQPADQHVFYDTGTAKAVANQIAERLAAVDPDRTDDYRSRAQEFGRRADALRQRESAIGTAHPGAAVVATEPVAHYLLRAAGLTDQTPPGFASAMEQDSDPAPVDIAAMLDLISTGKVAALMFNEQTVTEMTREVRAAAVAAGVPVVSVSETLPPDTDYLTWQSDTAGRLADALRR